MKQIFYILSLLFCIGCTKYNNNYTNAELKFNSECEKQLGIKYNGQNWGFNDMCPVQITQTRTVNVNSNEWESVYKLNVPADITTEEAEYVYNWFATHKLGKGEAIHWSDFFIQYVNSYNEVSKTTERNMDLLGYESISGNWEHVNNFNTQTHAMQYVYNAGTENWTYRSSFDDKYHNDLYSIQYLSFDINGHHYEGWYIGMDYEGIVIEGTGDERVGSVHADGFYNDWIVKVTPATKQDYPITCRIMCEDLGNSYDWDYNDIVFDVSYEEVWWPEHNITAIITLQASGGTMPIYAGIYDERYEAHKLFNADVKTVVIRPSAPAIYRINVTTTNPKDIPVYVNNREEAVYILKANSIPQKFCCPNTVDWSQELIDIRTTYPKWANWVNNNSIEFWK